jgi:hypothetical protein
MFKRSATALAALSLLVACDSDVANSPDGGLPPDGGALPDAGEGGGPSDTSPEGGMDAPPEPVAITDRPSRGSYSCRVARDRTDHSPLRWSGLGAALVATSGGTAYLARHEGIAGDVFNPPPPAQLVVGTLNAAGTFGPKTTVPAGTAVGTMAAAPRGDGFALVWEEDTKLRFAAFDSTGAIVIAARDVVPGVSINGETRIAAGPDGGFGVVFESEEARTLAVQFVVLSADGTVRMAPRRLDAPGTPSSLFGRLAPAIVGGPAGYTMVWSESLSERGSIEFARADASGAETTPRTRIATPGDNLMTGRVSAIFMPIAHGLLEVDGGFLVSWVESIGRGMPDTSTGRGTGAWNVVRLARVDGSGRLLGPPALLRPPTDSIDEVEPSLVRFGDAVAVMWARGTHIYLCGGCVPDHRVDLLLIDPTDLTPLSQVVSIASPGGVKGGGLLYRQVAVLGRSLLMTYRLQFHVHNTPGSATFECDRVK